MSFFVQHAFGSADERFLFFAWVIIVVFSICVHEYSHAVTALRLGDDTAAKEGHLSLNPLVQMGPTSLIALVLVGVAWGAVPVNPYLLGRQRAWVSFAGPFSNFLLSVAFAFLAVVAAHLPAGVGSAEMIERFFILGSTANAVLCIFNMLPVPMLDGWHVLAGFFPAMDRVDRVTASNFSWLLLAVILMTPANAVVWGGGEALAGFFVDAFFRIARVG